MECDIKVFCIFVAKNKINHVKLYLIMHSDFKERLLAHSQSDCWENAKEEWYFDNVFYAEEGVPCLCTDYPIKHVCVIGNCENADTKFICRSCANEVLEADIAEEIFSSVEKLKEDITKSMTSRVLEYMMFKGLVSGFEFEFYSNVMDKQDILEGQMNSKKIINQKLIDFTTYETFSTFSKIRSILLWASGNKRYRTNFVESIKRAGERNGLFSKKQIQNIDEIYMKDVVE